jgi:transposase
MDVALSDSDRKILVSWTRKSKGELRAAIRATLILALADKFSLADAARISGLHRHSAALWRDRYLAGGLKALASDKPRPGRPKSIPAEKVAAVLMITTDARLEGTSQWSVRSMAKVAGVSPASVHRIWSEHGTKPHLVRTFKISNDPKFEEKLVDVVGLYLNPPEKAVVLCIDEKSQIQALDRTQPGLTMKKGRCGTTTQDDERNGATTLCAAFDVLTGKVIGSRKKRHRHEEFIEFLNQVERKSPKDLDIHVVLDNYATHKHPEVKKWLAERPQFHFHFVPTSSSWLNQVERFFGLITQRRIRRGTFDSVTELKDAINEYIKLHNQEPKPFKWTASAEAIIEKVNRCREPVRQLAGVLGGTFGDSPF